MRALALNRKNALVIVTCGVAAFAGCAGDHAAGTVDGTGGASSNAGGSKDAGGATPAGGSSGSGASAKASGGAAGASGGSAGSKGGSPPGTDAGSGGNLTSDAAADSGRTDLCTAALFCEKFESYSGVSAITDKQKFGPWHAALTSGASMGLDGMHKTSGSNALHVHIDDTVTAGGRLFADGNQPIFANKPTHVYGRMMMYIDPNGTSTHWTFFGVNGSAEPGSPAVGRNAQYILSSLPKSGVNTYSFVYGLQAMGSDGYHDCSSQSGTSMPSAWACIAFDMDSVGRTLRMYKDGAANPILSVDEHGKGCVAPTSVDSPWYGPAVIQLFVGAWSFHEMNAPLDVWIDDVVVDTKPVTCPSQ